MPRHHQQKSQMNGPMGVLLDSHGEAKDSGGEVDRTFIGYSQSMDITERTSIACDRYKQPGTTCGEAQMTMQGGECDEVIFMKSKNGK